MSNSLVWTGSGILKYSAILLLFSCFSNQIRCAKDDKMDLLVKQLALHAMGESEDSQLQFCSKQLENFHVLDFCINYFAKARLERLNGVNNNCPFLFLHPQNYFDNSCFSKCVLIVDEPEIPMANRYVNKSSSNEFPEWRSYYVTRSFAVSTGNTPIRLEQCRLITNNPEWWKLLDQAKDKNVIHEGSWKSLYRNVRTSIDYQANNENNMRDEEIKLVKEESNNCIVRFARRLKRYFSD